MNQHCWMNSLVWNGRRGSAADDVEDEREQRAALPQCADGGVAHGTIPSASSGARLRPGTPTLPDWKDPGGGVTPFSRHHSPGGRSAAARRCRRTARAGAGSAAAAAAPGPSRRRARRRPSPRTCRSGRCVWALRNWRTTGSSELSSISRGPEHRQVPVVEQPDVVGHRARGVDVVGDDQEGRVDLGVEVDDQLVEERRAHRVEAGVGLVEEQDLGVEHQGAGQAGPLAHAAGDLAGQLVLGADAGRPGPSSP